MEERILKIEQQLLALKRDVNQVREVAAELVIGQSQNELAFIQIRNTLDEHDQKLNRLTALSVEILGQFIPLREQTFQNTENLLFLVKKHGELTDQVNRLEEELGIVKRSVFEHTILLKNLRRDVEVLKIDVAEVKSDVAQIKTDVAELKTDVAELKTDVAELKTDVAELKTDVAELKTDVAELKTDVAQIKTDVVELKTDMAQIKTDVADLKTGQAQILEALRNLKN